MKFRTEIEIKRSPRLISHKDRLMTVGSCFSDAIGSRLLRDGFDVSVNPMGILFNPLSIANMFERALESRLYGIDDLFRSDDGIYHCLDFESRRQSNDADELLRELNRDFGQFSDRLLKADRIFVTFGTAWVFKHIPSRDKIVGNCHKLQDRDFKRELCTVEDITSRWESLTQRLPIVFTVSPVRHLNNGLHGNTLSKAILQLAVSRLDNSEYFPAFEILLDDLRDYRFYADDLKHPSKAGEDYVYERFGEMFFSRETLSLASEYRRKSMFEAHRQIIK